MITFTNEFLRDRIYACWIGKKHRRHAGHAL